MTPEPRGRSRYHLIIDPEMEGRFKMPEGTVYPWFYLKEFKETSVNGINTLSSSGNPENRWKITRRLKDSLWFNAVTPRVENAS